MSSRSFIQRALEHLPALRRVGRRLTGNASEADDLVQETVARALERRGELRDPERLKGWLLAVQRTVFRRRRHMAACNPEWQERLSAWFDGEAEARERQAVERHLSGCAGCTREAARYASLREALKTGAAAEATVPPELKERIARLAPRSRPSFPRRRLAAALAAALASVGVLWTSWPSGMSEALAMDLERHHLKAFSRATPCEFESSDPAAVKAWVEREVGYAVEVPVVPGATLLGARRCRLHGQLSASLLYRYGERAMTLFLPPPGSSAAREAARFADEGPRCTQGPIGERICVAPRGGGEHAALAVSELESPVLLDALARMSP